MCVMVLSLTSVTEVQTPKIDTPQLAVLLGGLLVSSE